MSEHTEPDEQAIRERAYALWQLAGSPEGRDEEFWLVAQAELADGDLDEADEESFPASDAANRT